MGKSFALTVGTAVSTENSGSSLRSEGIRPHKGSVHLLTFVFNNPRCTDKSKKSELSENYPCVELDSTHSPSPSIVRCVPVLASRRSQAPATIA